MFLFYGIIFMDVITMKMIKGATIPNPELLKEEYEINETSIYANVDADKIAQVLIDFINMNDDLFLVIEFPCNQKEEEQQMQDYTEEEKKLYEEKGTMQHFHKNIYYMDGLSRDKALEIVEKYGDILINDGYCYFGFGNRKFDEVSKTKYNMMLSYSKEDIKKYEEIFKRNGIVKVDKLYTAWDQFSKDNPGESDITKEAHEVIEELLQDKMYLAKTVIDK